MASDAPLDQAPTPASSPSETVPRELQAWLENSLPLTFVYSRSMGGLIQTGRAVLSAMDAGYLELRTPGSTLIVVTRGARYSTEPQVFFNPALTDSRAIPGVSVSLENCDWLFLTPMREEGLVVHGHMLPGA